MKTILSLFDGISGTQVALNRLGVKVGKYYASEIDKFPISITQKNYPNTIQLGSVTDWQDWDIDWASIDLVVGGFPCQSWSVAGLGLGDKDKRGMLFWTMLDVMKKVLANNPQAKFLMENVRMKKSFEDYITFHTEEALGKVNKHLINSALVSAQNRKRFYWTNIEGIKQPEDQGLVLADILMDGHVVSNRPCEKVLIVPEATKKGYTEIQDGDCFDATFPTSKTRRGRNMKYKSNCLTATNYEYMRYEHPTYRKLRPCECEALQTFPIGYTEGISNSQRYKCLGNSFTVSVIQHILSNAFSS